ncbi:MAG TPA: OmpH family outer membrane protein [Burkholderiaceae bacterium]
MVLKSLIPSVNRHGLLALCAFGLACAIAAPLAQAQEFARIGFVNNERIMREANPAKIAHAKMEQEFSSRGKEIEALALKVKNLSDKFDKDMAGLNELEKTRRQRELVELDRDFQRKRREYNEDATQRLNEERSIFLEKANKVIRQIAEAEKFDIIFQEGVYVNPRIDITDKVLKVLNK